MRALVGAQFPQWRHLQVTSVPSQGWDNRSFRLGAEMLVRLPSARAYAPQVDKEQRWLPLLASRLPVAIPTPLARGQPAEGYPWPWSVYRWIEGETATLEVARSPAFAAAVADFLLALQSIDAAEGPPPGAHNFRRGGPLAVYDGEAREALKILGRRVDAAGAIWDAALASEWQGDPVWVHGDMAVGNLLGMQDRLCGVIDFGSLAIGDPACDAAIGWTVFRGESRKAFRGRLALDNETWQRARGWALWKGLIVAAGLVGSNEAEWADPWHTLAAILHD